MHGNPSVKAVERSKEKPYGSSSVSKHISSEILALKPRNVVLHKNTSTTTTEENKAVEAKYFAENHSNSNGQEKENSLRRNESEDGECRKQDSTSEACGPNQADNREGVSNSFDFIAHQAKCEFNFQLMIQSQELFPKLSLALLLLIAKGGLNHPPGKA